MDLESLNGSRINGRFRNQHWLRHGDTLQIGEATLTYDADGEPDGPPVALPQKAAKPVAAKPAAHTAAAKPAKPAVAPAPAPAAAAAKPTLARAAPARRDAPAQPAAAPAHRSAPVAPRRRQEEMYDEDGNRISRRVRAKQSNGLYIGLGVLAGLLVFGFIVMKVFGVTSSHNRGVMHDGADLAHDRKYAEAIALAERDGRPGERDYDLLQDAVSDWKVQLRGAKSLAREKESSDYWTYKIQRRSWSPVSKPINRMDDDQTVERITQWMYDYWDTLAVTTFLGNGIEPYPYYRQLLREHPDKELTAAAALRQIEVDVAARREEKDFAGALERLRRHGRIVRLRLTQDAWKNAALLLAGKEREIKSAAASALDVEMKRVRALVQAEEELTAITRLKGILRRYRKELAPEAAELLEKLEG